MEPQMDRLTVSAFFTFVFLVTPAHSTTLTPPTSAPSTLNGLTILASETELIPNLTDFVSVKCSYSKPDNSHVASVVSLSMSNFNGPANTTQELLEVTDLDPTNVVEKQNTGANVSGHLDQQGESFLQMAWKDPDQHVAARYMCSVSILDNIGRPVTTKVQTEIILRSVDLSVLTEVLKKLKDNQAALESTLEQEKAKNVAQQDIIDELDQFQAYGFKVSGFQMSNQVLYWSAKFFTFAEAETACSETGGQLAELSFQTLKLYTTQMEEAGMTNQFSLWVGLSREDADSPWVWTSTSTKATSIIWYRPPSKSTHCARFFVGWNGFYPWSCSAKHRALCTRDV